jgi:hypothetical protein
MKIYNDDNSPLRKQLKKIIIIAVFIFLVSLSGYEKAEGDINTIKKEVTVNDYKIINEREEKILSCLAFLESSNREYIKVLDSNNQYSYGLYQFQLSTLKDIYPSLSNEELEKIALDPVKSKEIARKLIFEKGEWWRWGNTIKKMEAGKCPNMEADELNNYK